MLSYVDFIEEAIETRRDATIQVFQILIKGQPELKI